MVVTADRQAGVSAVRRWIFAWLRTVWAPARGLPARGLSRVGGFEARAVGLARELLTMCTPQERACISAGGRPDWITDAVFDKSWKDGLVPDRATSSAQDSGAASGAAAGTQQQAEQQQAQAAPTGEATEQAEKEAGTQQPCKLSRSRTLSLAQDLYIAKNRLTLQAKVKLEPGNAEKSFRQRWRALGVEEFRNLSKPAALPYVDEVLARDGQMQKKERDEQGRWLLSMPSDEWSLKRLLHDINGEQVTKPPMKKRRLTDTASAFRIHSRTVIFRWFRTRICVLILVVSHFLRWVNAFSRG